MNRISPVEHCGHLMPDWVTSPRSECVLRPGHSGSHADDRGGRWWYDAGDIDWRQRAEQAEELLAIAHDTSNRSEAERALFARIADDRADTIAELIADRARLRTRLAEQEAETMRQHDRAQTALARVRAIHTRVLRMEALVCAHCGHVWPCPTIRALDQPTPTAAAQATDEQEQPAG